jgi:hypothetical protein
VYHSFIPLPPQPLASCLSIPHRRPNINNIHRFPLRALSAPGIIPPIRIRPRLRLLRLLTLIRIHIRSRTRIRIRTRILILPHRRRPSTTDGIMNQIGFRQCKNTGSPRTRRLTRRFPPILPGNR